MITPSFSITATERVLPKLALDFTTASLDPRVTFTRSGNTATVVNSSGYVVTINADLPRFDYDPVTLACKGLLIEEARTNLFTYSEDFGDASWVKSNATVSTNVAVSPSNVQNADKIVEAATTGSHFVEKVVSLTSGVAYTWSCFFKAAERSNLTLAVFTNVTHSGAFNLSNGTAGTTSNATSAISNMGGGWYRCSITFTSGATGNGFFDTYLSNGTSTSYAGNGTSGLYAWGAELEAGAFGTSYIPNLATGTTTRNADVATMTGTNFSSWYNANEGTFAAWASIPAEANARVVICAGDGTAGERILLATQSSRAGGEFRVVDGGVEQCDILPTYAYTAGQTIKLTGAYKVNSFAGSMNGVATGTDSSGTIPTPTTLYFGTNGVSLYSNLYIQKVLYWPQRLTNNEVQAFSK